MTAGPLLEGETFEAVFPFYILIDRELRVLSAGRSIRKIVRGLEPRRPLPEFFRLARPEGSLTYDELLRISPHLVVLEALSCNLRMRGSVQKDGRNQGLLFLGSPWITTLDELRDTGLALNDFAIFDTVADLIQSLQAQIQTNADMGELTARLRARGTELRNANQKLAKQNEELQEARAKAEKAMELRSQFLAMMSHEIRTPLNGILGLAKMLRDLSPSHAQEDLIERIDSTGTTLLGLLGNILELSKIDAGGVELTQNPIDLRACAEDAIEMVVAQARTKGLSLHLFVDERLPDAVLADGTRLRQVLGNLLSNAVKYTDKGRVELRMRRVALSQANALDRQPLRVAVAFQVSDTGIGIPEDQMRALFTPYSRGHRPLEQREGGSGLGLVITRRIVEALGASLQVSSRPMGGTTFAFRIEFPMGPTAVSVPPPSTLQDAKILLVGPLPEGSAEWVRDTLSKAGVRLEEALHDDRGEPALSSYDGAIVAAHRLQTTPAHDKLTYRDLPAVGIHQGTPSMDLPSTRVLSWPFRRKTLLRAVEQCILDRASAGARKPSLAPLPQGSPRVLLVEDNEVNRVVSTYFLQRFGMAAVHAKDGAQALEKAARGSFDLIFMDLQMPGMDGLETTRRLRALGLPKDPWIVALTAHAFAENREASLAAGMNDFLTKPIEMTALGQALQRWRDSQGSEGSVPAPAVAPPKEDRPPLDPALVNLYVRNARSLLARMEATPEAPELPRWAHQLRGSSLMVGFLEVADLCEKLEGSGTPASTVPGEQSAALIARARHAVEQIAAQFQAEG